jgi:DHA1 family 2-module integral membrane pump EmrD-like MFS transporter
MGPAVDARGFDREQVFMNQQPSSTEQGLITKDPLFILFLMWILTTLVPLTMDIYLPSLPAMVQALGSTSHVMQLTITINLLGYALSQLFYGPYSDRYGRRPVIIAGLLIAWVGSTVAVFASTPFLLIIGRLLQGVGLGVGNVLMRAVLRDILSGVRMARVGSYMGMTFAVLPAIAPVLGGYVQDGFGWRANFVLMLLFVTLVLALLFFYLPETNRQLNARATQWRMIAYNYSYLLTHKSFMGNVICTSCALSGMLAYYTASPFLFQNVLGLSPIAYGWLGIGVAVGLMGGNFANSLALNRWQPLQILQVGIVMMLLSSLTMFILSVFDILNVTAVLVPIVFFLAAGGLIYANAMMGALMPFAEMAGVAAALYGCLQVLGAFVTTLIVAGLHQNNQQALSLVFILLAVAALCAFYGLVKRS